MPIHTNKIKYFSIILLLGIFTQLACRKFVQIDPPSSSITGPTVYANNSSASAVMTGLYGSMINSPALSSGNLSIGYFMGLAADELSNYDPSNVGQVQFYTNSLKSSTLNGSNYYFWPELYNKIYVSNAAMEGVENSPSISAPIKQQITGEAKFMRAFLHFYATNLYGDVPLVTSTSYLKNDSIYRSPQSLVYQQIISDLKDAQIKLSEDYVNAAGNSTDERTRPNQGAATALLARVYLYTQQWDSSEVEATKIINNTSMYALSPLNQVFLANSTEAIWQLQPISPGYNTWDAFYYVLLGPPGPGENSVALTSWLTNAFEPGDARQTNWVGAFTSDSIIYYSYPFKYQVWQQGSSVSEYTMVLRLAEQYLIRAEARAEQGNILGAQADLNMIRNRAGLDTTTANDKSSLLTAIMQERRVELFTEWGHRWFDLKRTGNLNEIMGTPGSNICQNKGGTWNPDWALLPIAYQELIVNHNLHQNPGY